MSKKIFIDGLYPSNTAIVATDANNRIEEILMDNSLTKSIRSNIYLGVIVRIEHSLQAAFVDYGGEKNGFLPFSDIHPDYYQLSAADKEVINAEIKNKNQTVSSSGEEEDQDDVEDGIFENNDTKNLTNYDIYKRYNIQDVIKKGQNVLVQVYKDERGSKGASLTTYISLPGRYCVFMPNSLSGIGVSKKITEPAERNRVMSMVKKFPLAPGMSMVVRTAGNGASEEELYKDYEYLIGLWNKITTKTLQSNPLSLIYSESGIVKQSIRDMYGKDTESIIVQGESTYNEVVSILSEFVPQDVSKVVFYKDKTPMFVKFGIEKQMKDLLYERVDLQSGGYIIIQPTEALVSIDVNSGKSTAEKNIEDMALKINLEAATEIARQLRLRDLGGLIVIDFIDMLDIRNRKMVERTLKSAFYNDRAKVQISRISIFGLLELSRQRIRSSINDMSTVACESCGGSGKVRAAEIVVGHIFKDLSQLEWPEQGYEKLEIFCSQVVASSLNTSKKEDIVSLQNSAKIVINIIEDRDMIVDQYKIVAKVNKDDNGSVVSDYKGTPLSLYYYEKENQAIQRERDVIKTIPMSSGRHEDKKPRLGVRNNNVKHERSRDNNKTTDYNRNKKPDRHDRNRKQRYYDKKRNNDSTASNPGIITKIFSSLFGRK